MQKELIWHSLDALLQSIATKMSIYDTHVAKLNPPPSIGVGVFSLNVDTQEALVHFNIECSDEKLTRLRLDEFVNNLYLCGAKEPEPKVTEVAWQGEQTEEDVFLFGKDAEFKPNLHGYISIHI